MSAARITTAEMKDMHKDYHPDGMDKFILVIKCWIVKNIVKIVRTQKNTVIPKFKTRYSKTNLELNTGTVIKYLSLASAFNYLFWVFKF